jgi:SAM-dependent methyltransferase
MRLCLFSFLILFFEFALIRYIPAHVKATSYFANLTIIGTFLGMGLGTILSRRRTIEWAVPAFPFLLYLLFFCVHYFSNYQIEPFSGPSEFFWPATGIHNVRVKAIGIFWVITVFFILSTACFVPLGYGLGREFPKYRPLVAYSLDIVGSILGIVVFALMSNACLPPFTWVVIGGLVFAALVRENRRKLIGASAMIILTASMAYLEDLGRGTVTWSPYYKITESDRSGPGKPIFVNDGFHQNMVDMRPDNRDRPRFYQDFTEDYHRPYSLVGPRDEVLILGSGTGNDVAVSLLSGAKQVDAVEIDPVILSIGVRDHPNHPYEDKRVTAYNTDARVYLKNSTKKYDLIVYATLDSHTILAGQSNIRLDNYLYTLEALEDVKRLLREDGVFLLQFLALKDYIATRLHDLVKETFDRSPCVLFFPNYRHFNHSLLARKDGAPVSELAGVASASPLIEGSYRLPADNWPFLYLRSPSVPRHYFHILGMILVVAVFGVIAGVGKDLFRGTRPVMFFLGAGFLLLETKSITEFSLLFGSTWTVNLFVILGILIVILAANLLVLRFPAFPRRIFFVGLILSLILCFGIPVKELLEEDPVVRDLVTMVFTGLPVLFAAGLFASCFQEETESAVALGWNLLGAVVGGLLEYSSMYLGIKALYLLALCLYAAAGVAILAQRGCR